MDLLTQCDVTMVTTSREAHEPLLYELTKVCRKSPRVYDNPAAIAWLESAPRYRLMLLDYAFQDGEHELSDRSYERSLRSANLALFNSMRRLEVEVFALLTGMQGVFFECEPVDDILRGLTAILSGELWFRRRVLSTDFYRRMESKARRVNAIERSSDSLLLSSREREILQQMMRGASNKQIADQLCISEHTVRTHNYRIYRKIQVRNRVEALNWAESHL